jgi:hypothetical protein
MMILFLQNIPEYLLYTKDIWVNILAIELPSLRISPLLLIRVVTIVLLYVVAVLFTVIYIQSIGSDIGIFSGLFSDLLSLQFCTVEEFLVSCSPSEGGGLAPHLLMGALLPGKLVESNRLTNLEKQQFSLSEEISGIIVGLILGDLHIRKRKLGVNPCLVFRQGVVHKDYLLHLYEKFQMYCPQEPQLYNSPPHKLTGISYSSMYFQTYSLPCFAALHALFYPSGKKIVPANIADLFTPLSLSYWIADDGSFHKINKVVTLATHCFSLDEVNLLVGVLNKWDLKCRVSKDKNGYVITIPFKSLPVLQSLLKDIMPSMMQYKIGL